jgi:ornithine decarboxylase
MAYKDMFTILVVDSRISGALISRGDLVLFDRNNHKSNHHGALVLAGGIPVYVPTDRNPQGLVGPMILERIGHLCDCILFDEAWGGFMKFHPLFAGHYARTGTSACSATSSRSSGAG